MAKFWAALASIFLEFFWPKIQEAYKNFREKLDRRKEIETEAKKSAEPLKKAETKEEIEKATDNILDGF